MSDLKSLLALGETPGGGGGGEETPPDYTQVVFGSTRAQTTPNVTLRQMYFGSTRARP